MSTDQTPEREIGDLRKKLDIALSANYPGTTASKQFLDDCMMFVTAYADRQERAGRIDELETWIDDYSEVLTEYNEEPKASLILKPTHSETLIHLSELKKRLAELHQTGRSGEGTE